MLVCKTSVTQNKQFGTIEHLLVMPITPIEIMLAKIWPMGLVGNVGDYVIYYFRGTRNAASAN
jgi:ABC-2 type transport system permease protein